jgi:ABC-type transporter Mla subunit MlaD
MPWSPDRPAAAAEDPWQAGTARRLETIGRILDESRDLLDTALERNTGVEQSLRRAEYQTRDLQWDAAKILLDDDPARPAMRTVQAGGDQLVTDLRHTQAQAEDLRDTLRQARRHLDHATPLVTELTGATRDPEHAVAAAMLATRLERLNTLVELATPLAERTSTRIERAHQALDAGLMQTGDRSTETFHQFWNLDRGIFDTARELAHASAANGAELTEHAVNASTLTAAHSRDMQRLPRCSPTRPGTYPYPAARTRPGPAPGPPGPAI